MATSFTGASNFSGMNGSGGFYIEEVIHKTYLKFDDFGIEAFGVTILMWEKVFLLLKQFVWK